MNIVIDIKQFVNSEAMIDERCKLYLSDDIKELERLSVAGLYAVPIATENNRNEDFSAYKYIVSNPEEIDDDYYLKIWQRFEGIPWTILETQRCIIREMCEKDVEELYGVYADESITDFTEDLFPDYEDELEYTRNYIAHVYSYFGFGTWLIVDKLSGNIIGRAGFNYREGFDCPELGYVIAKEYQGKGIATEVCEAIIDYGFAELEFNEIMAFSARENIASVKLLNNLGFFTDISCEKLPTLLSKGKEYTLYKYNLNKKAKIWAKNNTKGRI